MDSFEKENKVPLAAAPNAAPEAADPPEGELPEEETFYARKVGLPRFFELLGRDLFSFYKASFLCVLAFLPGTALAGFALLAEAPLLCLLGGLLAGLLGGPVLCGLIDTVLRALRDEPGYWWHTYRRAWRQNWRQSLLPGLTLGLFLSGWVYMARTMAAAGTASTALWVATLVCVFVGTGFMAWLFSQIPLVNLPLPALLKNTALMFFGFFPRTLAAALVLGLYWGVTLLYLPYTLFIVLAFGFWLPVLVALMLLYPGLDKSFQLEKTLKERRDAETSRALDEAQPVFTPKER